MEFANLCLVTCLHARAYTYIVCWKWRRFMHKYGVFYLLIWLSCLLVVVFILHYLMRELIWYTCQSEGLARGNNAIFWWCSNSQLKVINILRIKAPTTVPHTYLCNWYQISHGRICYIPLRYVTEIKKS